MTLLTIPLIAAGCGGGSEGESDPPRANLALNANEPPSERDCGFDTADAIEPAAPGSGRIDAPEPGVYLYATTGTQTTPGEGREQLPHETESVVTPSRKAKDLVCFGSERSLSKRTRTPEVYVLRGEDVYITALGFDTPNLVETVSPRPAVLALSGTSSSWSGSFKGTTSGTYRIEITGRRTFTIGGEKVKAVGLQSDASYSGEASGTRRTMTWLALDRSIVLQETGQSRVEVGGGDERLDYEIKLLSLEPGKP